MAASLRFGGHLANSLRAGNASSAPCSCLTAVQRAFSLSATSRIPDEGAAPRSSTARAIPIDKLRGPIAARPMFTRDGKGRPRRSGPPTANSRFGGSRDGQRQGGFNRRRPQSRDGNRDRRPTNDTRPSMERVTITDREMQDPTSLTERQIEALNQDQVTQLISSDHPVDEWRSEEELVERYASSRVQPRKPFETPSEITRETLVDFLPFPNDGSGGFIGGYTAESATEPRSSYDRSTPLINSLDVYSSKVKPDSSDSTASKPTNSYPSKTDISPSTSAKAPELLNSVLHALKNHTYPLDKKRTLVEEVQKQLQAGQR